MSDVRNESFIGVISSDVNRGTEDVREEGRDRRRRNKGLGKD